MDTVGAVMHKIIERCDICINGCAISKELLMRSFSSFLSATIEKEKHNIGIVMHTGSVCFDALMLSYAALTNILYNKTDSVELVHALNKGDMVVYKKQRYYFMGFVNSIVGSFSNMEMMDDGKYIVLQQDSNWTAIPQKSWSGILPYQGKSTRLDGRGLRKDNGKRKDFFKTVLDMNESDVPSTIDVSTIVVMPRERATELIQGLSFRYGDKEIKYTELVTVSYFTEGDQEYPLGNNAAKVEPVIKITSKVSVARKLLLKKDWNSNIGLIVLGEDSLVRGQSELPELIERKSIQYVYLCSHVDSESCQTFLNNYEEVNLFVCTKEFLLSNSKDIVEQNCFTLELDKQVNVIIDHEVTSQVLEGVLSWEEYKKFKKAMYFIKTSDYDSEVKDDFVVQSFALMNLFMTATFPIIDLEIAIAQGKIANVESPADRIERLELSSGTFPKYLLESAELVMDMLRLAYRNVFNDNAKTNLLEHIVESNRNRNICVVVPKAYYVTLLSARYGKQKGLAFTTANKYENSRICDLAICVGNFTGRKFDIFRCKSATDIFVMLYEAENYQYRKRLRNAAKNEHTLNERSTIIVEDYDYIEEKEDEENNIIDEIEIIDSEVSSFTGVAAARSARLCFDSNSKSQTTDIVAIAKFDTGEVAFFTKHYKAYVLDEEGQTAKEVKVEELAEGDTIVFTRSNSKTRDIVDGLIQNMISNGNLSKNLIDVYERSKIWKIKLREYMKINDLSAKAIAKKMFANGITVTEATIRRWLDEDSHTVGPRELESIQQIAILAKDDCMLEQAEIIFQSCAEVRGFRRKILDAIGMATLTKVTGHQITKNSILATVSEQIDDMAVVLQIENIVFISDSVPVHMINRPVSIGID